MTFDRKGVRDARATDDDDDGDGRYRLPAKRGLPVTLACEARPTGRSRLAGKRYLPVGAYAKEAAMTFVNIGRRPGRAYADVTKTVGTAYPPSETYR